MFFLILVIKVTFCSNNSADSLEEEGSAPYPLTVNNGGNRINFRVLDRNSNLLLKTNSEEKICKFLGVYLYQGSLKDD